MSTQKNHRLVIIILILLAIQAGLIYYFLLFDAEDKSELFSVFTSKKQLADLAVHRSYFSNQEFYEEAYERLLVKKADNKVYGGIVPHHLMVKENIAAFFEGLKDFNCETVVLIGPNHFNQGKNNIILSQAKWQTPYGELMPDLGLVQGLVDQGYAVEESAFNSEHAISGLVGFIKKSLPQAKLVPIILKVDSSEEEISLLAEALKQKADPEKILVIASVDFSHYLTANMADFHDVKSRSVIASFDFERIYDLEIDSPASVYALLKYLELIGAQNPELLFSTNSGKLIGQEDKPTTSHNIYYFTQHHQAAGVSPGIQNHLAGEPSLKPQPSGRGAGFTQGQAASDKTVNFLFFGDLMLDRNVGERVKELGLPGLFKDLAAAENRFFWSQDLTSANLEGAVTNGGQHYPPNNSYDFAFSPDLIKELKKYNFNYFSSANNHFTDQGAKGVAETTKNLAELGISSSGCPDGQVGECSSVIKEIAGKKIGLAGLSMIYQTFDLSAAEKIIDNLKASADFIVVNIHWGSEYVHQFNQLQKNIGRSLIDAGADVVIGHHPHVAQGLEIYQGKPIFYSLGNFIFDQYFSKDTQQGLAVGLAVTFIESGDYKIEYYFFPFKSILSQPVLMDKYESEAFFKDYLKWSNITDEYKELLKLPF